MPGKDGASKAVYLWAVALTLFMFVGGGLFVASGDSQNPRVLVKFAWTCGVLALIAVGAFVVFACKSRQGLDEDGEESRDFAMLMSAGTVLWFLAWVGFSLCLVYWNVAIVKAICALIIWAPPAWLASKVLKALCKGHGPMRADTADYIDRRRMITGEYEEWRRR